jgi:hypothetical protein
MIVIDESVLAYQPSKEKKAKMEEEGEPIPVVFIPRKPHKNGLLLYSAVGAVRHPNSDDKKLPWIVDIEPHLTAGDTAPHDVVRTMISRWKFYTKPEIVADAGFGSFDLCEDLSKSGVTVTFSMPLKSNPALWDVLSLNTIKGSWRAAKKGPVIASGCTSATEKGVLQYHQVISNSFSLSGNFLSPVPSAQIDEGKLEFFVTSI